MMVGGRMATSVLAIGLTVVFLLGMLMGAQGGDPQQLRDELVEHKTETDWSKLEEPAYSETVDRHMPRLLPDTDIGEEWAASFAEGMFGLAIPVAVAGAQFGTLLPMWAARAITWLTQLVLIGVFAYQVIRRYQTIRGEMS
jgi:hypothetical protein